MPWIESVPPERAEGSVRDVYEEMKKAMGMVSPAFAVMSLDAGYLRGMWDLHRVVMRPGRLTEAQKETLALAVSAVNDCGFCRWAHGGRLRSLGLDPATVETLATDPEAASLEEPERALVAWAVKVTRAPAAVTPEDLEALRKHGWDDGSLTEATAVVGHLNHLNRTLDALGVEAPG